MTKTPKNMTSLPYYASAVIVVKVMREQEQSLLRLAKFVITVKKINHFASKCAAGKNPRQKKKRKRGRRSGKKSPINQCELEDSEDEIVVVSNTQEEVNVVTSEHHRSSRSIKSSLKRE